MSPVAIPMVILPMTFIFVLLIVLTAKAPRAGACLIGGLIFLAPIFLLRVVHAGGMPGPQALPLFIIPAVFLFVLLIILLTKAPKAGAGLIVAIVVMAIMGLFLMPVVSHRRESPVVPSVEMSRWTESMADQRRETIQVWDQTQPSSGVGAARVRVPRPTPPAAPSPIWSEGVEQEFEADVYPSSLAAAKALGRRMAWPIRDVAGDPNAAIKVILFQEGNDRSLVSAFGRAMEKELPGAQCSIEADVRNIRPGEVGLTLRADMAHLTVALAEGAGVVLSNPQENTRIVATAFTEDRRASAEAGFIDKPWVENFSAYASARPNETFIVVRSNGTCTSESEANQQALDDARARLTEAIDRREGGGFAQMAQPAVSTTDVLNGGFVADRFMQGFDTSMGKVWRQALLIDVSGPKLTQLFNVKIHQGRQIRESWARMGFSVIGALVLIGAIYFFLNMATRGYYEWSLRIAGVILAIVAIVSILMIVH